MHEHAIHSFINLLPFLIALYLLLPKIRKTWDKNALLGIVLCLIVLFHQVPLITMFMFHHQASSHTLNHPCCLPQIASTIPQIILKPPLEVNLPSVVLITKIHDPIVTILHNTRSPPLA